MRFSQKDNSLLIEYGSAVVMITPWGADSLRVRMTRENKMDEHNWALTMEPACTDSHIDIHEIDTTEPWWHSDEEIKKHSQSSMEASITNGKITAKVSFEGWISFYNDKGELLTEEYWRNRNRIDRYSQASVPFYISSRGYGFLWNNPAVGNVVFGNNKTERRSCVKWRA